MNLREKAGVIHWGIRRRLRAIRRRLTAIPGRLKMRLPASARKKINTLREWRFKQIEAVYQRQGLQAAIEKINSTLHTPRQQSRAYILLVRLEMNTDVNSALALVTEVLKRDPARTVWAAMATWNAGNVTKAHHLLQQVSSAQQPSAIQEMIYQIEGAYRLLQALPKIPPAASTAAYQALPRKILYVASSSRPYHVTGYTSRTHHLLKTLQGLGWDVHCVTRAGYPYDRPDTRQITRHATNTIEGIVYERLEGCHRRELPYDEYLQQAVAPIEDAARRLRPAIIHAASNYEAGLPALIAARHLGIPFCYEVRGLWEYTAASKKPGWELTERFMLDSRLEGLTASHADRVFTLTNALAAELQGRGVQENNIDIVPNAVDASAFAPLPRDEDLATGLGIAPQDFVIGYIGSIVQYEGLDDLITAFVKVSAEVPFAKLLIVGDGDSLAGLKELARASGLTNKVIFTGRVQPGLVANYFSLLSVMTLPRKPCKVCELVSPMKPFEAMAMQVPLVVSDVAALHEIVVEGQTALVHKAGNPESLAGRLIQLANAPALQRSLAVHGQKHINLNRQWHKVVQPLTQFYEGREVYKKPWYLLFKRYIDSAPGYLERQDSTLAEKRCAERVCNMLSRHGKKYACTDRGVLVDAIAGMSVARKMTGADTVFLHNAGSSGSHWVMGMLNDLGLAQACGEVKVSREFWLEARSLGKSDNSNFIDCVHLLHSYNLDLLSSVKPLVNSSHMAGWRIADHFTRPRKSVLLLRNPVDIVVSRTFRKSSYRDFIASDKTDDEYLSDNIVFVKNFYASARSRTFDYIFTYEDMKASPYKQLSGLLQALQYGYSESRLRQVVDSRDEASMAGGSGIEFNNLYKGRREVDSGVIDRVAGEMKQELENFRGVRNGSKCL